MNWFARLTVRTKLIGGFLVVAAIAAIIGVVGVRSTNVINNMSTTMYQNELLGLHHASRADTALVSAGRSIRGALLVLTRGERDRELQELGKHFDELKSEFGKLEPLFVTEEGKTAVRQTLESVLSYEAAIKKVVEVLKTEPPGGAMDSITMLTRDALPHANKAQTQMQSLVTRKLANAVRFSDESENVYDNSRNMLITMTAGGALLALMLGWLITRGLTRQLGGEPAEVARIAGSIAQGDLTNTIDLDVAKEGSIIYAMSTMQESLRGVVGTVRASSENIAMGSTQIAAGNADLSQRTEEQAANLTETAAAVEELSSTVRSSADVAVQAAQLAGTASAAAAEGGRAVQDVVQVMDGINQASRRIVDIIGVIDGIAFQTNILALNAAVEAARAGEQGRGFAVVATEVRSLAQRSASAAKDIKTLIDDSVAKVDQGGQMVDAAGQAMDGIVAQVARVTDLINEISAATREQTIGIGQINEAVGQLSDVTQHNAALVEESAVAAESLNDQAKNLVDVVGVFRVGEEQPVAKRLKADLQAGGALTHHQLGGTSSALALAS